jgi:hypothetical protein
MQRASHNISLDLHCLLWVNIGSLCKAAILAQVGYFYSGGVGQYYSGANNLLGTSKPREFQANKYEDIDITAQNVPEDVTPARSPTN